MQYRLLIVDDEEHILSGIKSSLDWTELKIGRIEVAASYQEAINLAIEMNPDIAIVDICLGEYKGYDLIQKMNELGLKTKYLIMSGYDDFEYARKALLCGAKAYLLKPLDRFEMRNLIKRIIIDDLHGELPDELPDTRNVDPVIQMPYMSLSKLTNKIIMIISENYSGNVSLKTVADTFKMNSTYLGQIFLKDTHIKFNEYLMRYRLLKAKELIMTTDEKIAYIAKRVGFSSTNYFYISFHEMFQCSPTDLRDGRQRKEEE